MLWFPWLFPSQRVLLGRILHECVVTHGFCLWQAQAIYVPSKGSCRVRGRCCSRVAAARGGDGLCPCPATGTGGMSWRSSTGCGTARGSPPPQLVAHTHTVNRDCGSARCRGETGTCSQMYAAAGEGAHYAASVEACVWWACSNFHP